MNKKNKGTSRQRIPSFEGSISVSISNVSPCGNRNGVNGSDDHTDDNA